MQANSINFGTNQRKGSRLIVVAYPKISERDYDWVQEIREKNDRLSFEAIDPHFTLFSPSGHFTQEVLVDAIKRNIKGAKSFRFALRCAVLMPPIRGDYTYVFLVPDEGFSHFVNLRNRVYRASMAKALDLEIPFIPHLTVGSTKNLLKGKRIVDELNGRSFRIAGVIDALAVVAESGDRNRTIQEIALDAARS